MNTSLQRLRYFVAVAEELSFTRAASRLHVSQPSLSAQVRALELSLGLQLLRRTTRRVELTDAGRVLHDDLRRILADLDASHARARRAQDGASSSLRVAYTASVGYQALPLILDELEAARPDLTVSAHRTWSTRVLDALRAGEVDLGFVREFEGAPDLEDVTLRMERLAAFFSVGHPFAERDSVRMEDLQDTTLVVVPASLAPGFHDLVLALCGARGFVPRVIELSAPDNREPLLAHLSRHKDRVFVGPVSMSSTSWEGVTHVPVEDDDARMGLSAVWLASDGGSALRAAIEAALTVSEREGWMSGR